jgi:hypothetical protein
MDRSIVITGASKGIGRAAAHALVEDGWSVIGVARSSPTNFPGIFIEADLADREKTQVLADDLLARGSVVGIVNIVGLARHERVDTIDPAVFAMVMGCFARTIRKAAKASAAISQKCRCSGSDIRVRSLPRSRFSPATPRLSLPVKPCCGWRRESRDSLALLEPELLTTAGIRWSVMSSP